MDICHELKKRFAETVRDHCAEGILFSGGLDSALVAAYSRESKAISVALESYSEDRFYMNAVATFLTLDLHSVNVTINEALETVPEVIRILRTFDPVIPNDVTVYLGLKYAKETGIQSVMTGDGSDEVFAGYSFMQGMENLEEYLRRMHSAMRFSSNEIGKYLGVEIRQPFLDEDFLAFGKDIDLSYKIRNERGAMWGKWILRKAFEDVLPREILWQSKRPLESGSGMTKLRSVIETTISDKEFEEGRKTYPVQFWNKEHFYYYRIYRDIVGDIPVPGKGEKECACCGAGMAFDAFHCRVCGDVVKWNQIK